MSGRVDLDRLRVDVYELTRSYMEHPVSGARELVVHGLRRRQQRIDLELRDLGVRLGRDEPNPPDPSTVRDARGRYGRPWPLDVRVLLHERRTVRASLTHLTGGRQGGAGMLDQLENPLRHVMVGHGPGDGVHGAQVGSRPPVSLAHRDLLAMIEAGVWQFDADLRDALDDHVDTERPFRVALEALPALAMRLDDAENHPLTVRLARAVRGWRTACRVQLGYTAPMTTLATPCRYCGQTAIIVRADMTSDMVCTGMIPACDVASRSQRDVPCTDPDGEPSRWSRYEWALYLEDQHEHGLVGTDAAALLARVSTSVIRGWKHRGLIVPAGGTERHPLWRRDDIMILAEQTTPSVPAASEAG